MSTSDISVRPISAEEHRAFIEAQPSASFLQTPAWARVKAEWDSESVGWFVDGELIGAALVLYRRLPKLKNCLAYLPEGPVLDWGRAVGVGSDDLEPWLAPLVAHAKSRRAFGIRIGPTIVLRRWDTDTIKDAIADDTVRSLLEVEPDFLDTDAVRLQNQLDRLGWLPPKPEGEGFAAGQPAFNFWLPLAHPDGTAKTPDEILKGMNQQWRRNIKKAAKSGVEVTLGGRDDLAEFHRIYVETAERDDFTPRPLTYFESMFDAMTAEDPDRLRLYLAHHEGDLVAATTWVRVGEHAWYSYGASTNAKRDVRGSNAIQWQMMQDALEAGAKVYDLRGITDSVASDDPHLGLIRFKVGTGGGAVQYPGEWDKPLNPVLYRAFDLYMNRAVWKARATSLVSRVTKRRPRTRETAHNHHERPDPA